MGKIEGQGDQWHGHVTALSVAPQYRRLNLAAKLMNALEQTSEKYGSPLDHLISDLNSNILTENKHFLWTSS